MEKTDIPWSSAGKWREAITTLRFIIQQNRQALGTPFRMAAEIRIRLIALFPLLDELGQHLCSACGNPCCRIATVWFDHADLVYIHLNQLNVPPRQIGKENDNGCAYLEVNGCGLPRQVRPWICTRYLCAVQMDYLRNRLPTKMDTLLRQMTHIRDHRKAMEDRFIHTVCG